MKDTETVWKNGKEYHFEWYDLKENSTSISLTEIGNSEEIEMLETYDFKEVC